MLEVAAQPSATKKQKPAPKSHMHWVVLKITWCLKKKNTTCDTHHVFWFSLQTCGQGIIQSSRGETQGPGLLSTSLLGQDHVSVMTCTVCHLRAVCGGQLQYHFSGGADAQPCRFIGNVIYYIRNLWKHEETLVFPLRLLICGHCFLCIGLLIFTGFYFSLAVPSLNRVFITTFLLLLLLAETLQALD